MPTLTIAVSDKTAQRLQEIAAAGLVSPEAVVENILDYLDVIHSEISTHPGQLLLEAEAPTQFEPRRLVRLRRNARFYELKYVNPDRKDYREGDIFRAMMLEEIYDYAASNGMAYQNFPESLVTGIRDLIIEGHKAKVARAKASKQEAVS